MCRYRLDPTPDQARALAMHCAHARFVWNLAVERHAWWRPGRRNAPSWVDQSAQLTEARREFGWLRAGCQMVQQQALRDFGRAMTDFFAGTHRRPTFRKAGRHEGFRIVAVSAGSVRRVSRRVGQVWVPKVGWVRFRWSRPVPVGVKSYRITCDRAGRWHVAFAAIPTPIPGPGTGEVVDVDRGVTISIRVEDLDVRAMTRSARGTMDVPGRCVRAKAGLNRGILANAWGGLVARLEQKAPGRVQRINPRYTSQVCSSCGHHDSAARENQARYRCRACGLTINADVNAAINIAAGDLAAGRAVTARGALQPLGGAANREPQLVSSVLS